VCARKAGTNGPPPGSSSSEEEENSYEDRSQMADLYRARVSVPRLQTEVCVCVCVCKDVCVFACVCVCVLNKSVHRNLPVGKFFPWHDSQISGCKLNSVCVIAWRLHM